MKPLDSFLKPILPVITALLVLLFQSVTVKAQEYPVQVTTLVTPPYSLYLSDYASPEGNAMQLIIQLRELDRPEYRVKLRFTIEGQGITLRTKPSYVPRALVLQGGIPEILSGPDLSAYLNPDNLDFSGISRQEFLKKATFPEGFYTFKVEVIDYARDVVVSNAGFANAWIILNDPPIVNLPFNEEKVNATDPQNVMFSWTPRHAASPNAAFSTEYEFTLVELYPANRNPNDAIRAANSIFVTQTTSTSMNYGIMEPLLIPGRKYAFRIRAYDVGGRDLFKNNGYSEVHVFQFGDACVPPPGIKADALDAVRMKLSWDQIDLHTGYGIKYRKKGSSSWYEENVFSNSSIIPGLQGGATYEYQVKGVCGSIQGDFSPVATVSLPEAAESEFSCGAPVPAVELKTTPLPGGLRVDDVIKTSDFEISVSEVTANADGSYKGKGFALIPWFKFASVRVKFSNIQVNEEYRVYSGNVTTIYDPNSRFKVELDLSKDEMEGEKGDGTAPVTPFNDPDFNGVDTTYVGTIAAITVDATTGVVTIVDANGASVTIPRKENTKTNDPDDHEPMRVTDSKGDTYIIDKDGNVLKGPSTAPPGAVASRDSVNFTANFAANANQEYGFDKKGDTALGTYDKISIQGKDYLIPWKAVEAGRQDVVNVLAEGRKNFPAMVGFKTITGPVPSQAGASADLKQIFVTGKAPDDTEAVSAYVLLQEPGQPSPQEIEVGKVNVKTYSKVKQKLFIVPVNDAPVPDKNSLLTEINRIYQQAVAEWDITVDTKFTIGNESIAGLDAEESGMFSSYNQKMKQFNRAFKDDRSVDKDAYYIFLINGSGSNRSGIMPFKKQFGYVFTDNSSDLLTTIAHELGHGAFNLRHTFSEFPAVSQRSTQNLMDYKGGKELKKYQWDNVHDPEAMIGWLQDDDESGSIAEASLACINAEVISKLKGNFTFYDPSGAIIDLAKDSKGNSLNTSGIVPYAFFTTSETDQSLIGKLSAFKINGVLYMVYYFVKDLKFAGYAPANRSFASGEAFEKEKYTPGEGTAANVQVIKITVNGNGGGGTYEILTGGVKTDGNQLADCKCGDLPKKKEKVPIEANIVLKCLPDNLTKIGKEEYYYHVNGKVILLNSNYTPFAFVGTSDTNYKQGSLAVIKKSDGKLYYAAANKRYYLKDASGQLDAGQQFTEFVEGSADKATVVQIDNDCNYSITRSGQQSTLVKATSCNCTGDGGSGSSQGGSKVIDLTGEGIDLSSIKDLIDGKLSYNDPNAGLIQASVAHIFLTSDAHKELIQQAKDAQVPSGIIKIWIHKNETGVWLIKEGNNTQRLDEIYKKKFGPDFAFDLNQELQSQPGLSLTDIATAAYKISDWLSSKIAKLYIPEAWWNCDNIEENGINKSDPRYYNPPWFIRIVKKILSPAAVVVDTFVKAMLPDDPELQRQLNRISAENLSFALAVGLWDGLIGLIDALPQTIKLATMNFADDPKAKQSVDEFSKLVESNGGGFIGVGKMMFNAIISQFDIAKPCVFAHSVGTVAFDVIVAIFTAGSGAAASKLGNILKTIATTLDKLDVLGNIVGGIASAGLKVAFKGANKVLTFSVRTGVKLIEATVDKGRYVIKVFNATVTAVSEINWSPILPSKVVGLDGALYNVPIFIDPIKKMEGAIYRVKQILKDENGVPIKNENGDVVVEVEVEVNGTRVEETELAVVKGLGNAVKRVQKILSKPFTKKAEHDLAEFTRQLKDQETGLNELTVDEFIKNRDAYIARKQAGGDGRSPEGDRAQKEFREEAIQDRVDENIKKDMTPEEALREAQEWAKDKAALHNPDQIAGGNPLHLTRLGDSNVNSSIGGQWPTRIGEIDQKIRDIASKMTEAERQSTYLDIELVIGN